jgi:phosphoribosyl 1,2-cyclic phosphodiesterase
MLIRSWGSRGAIPVSGRDYLEYGGDTTCLEIRAESGDLILVDAGTGIRRFGNSEAAAADREFNVIFTHAHWDHIMGFPFFKPLYFRRNRIRLHGCPFNDRFVKESLSRVMAPPYFPVNFAGIKARIDFEEACPQAFQIGSVVIHPIALSHPNGGSGYAFVENGRRFVFLTDNELGFRHPGGRTRQEYVEFAAGADLLIHDAEYTPAEYRLFTGWGHSVYTDAIQLAADAGCRRLGLFHLNQERTDGAMEQILADCRRIIAAEAHRMECFGVSCDWQLVI